VARFREIILQLLGIVGTVASDIYISS